MTTSETIIEVRGVSFRFGQHAILNEITFSIQKGEYISIIGPNGSGKTTILRCLDRIYPVPMGNIQIHGISLAAYKQKNLAKLIGYVPQITSQAFSYTVFEFIKE